MKRLINAIIQFFRFLPEPELSEIEQEVVRLRNWCEKYGEGTYSDEYLLAMAEKRLRPPISRRL